MRWLFAEEVEVTGAGRGETVRFGGPLGAWGAEPSRSGAPDTRGKVAKEMEFHIPRKMDFEELTGCVPEIL